MNKVIAIVAVAGISAFAAPASAEEEFTRFTAGAIIRDTPSRVRPKYKAERPDLCPTPGRLIFNGTLYISPDRVVPRGVCFRHNHPTVKSPDGPKHNIRLAFEMPEGVEVTGGAHLRESLAGDKRFPAVEKISLNGKPATRYTLKISYLPNRPKTPSYMAYFRTSLPAGSVSQCRYYLTWKGGRQEPQTIRLESIRIPNVRPPKRMFIMPWGLVPDHVALLAPNFADDYTTLGMNMISFEYLGHWRNPPRVKRTKEELREYIELQATLYAKARVGGVYTCYGGGGSFFPFSPSAQYGMVSWMSDPDARAIGVDGQPVPGWLAGFTPCPSYRGKFYQEAIITLETSELLRRAPANFFNFDTEYYGSGGRGAKICFGKRCVGLFEKWFKARYPRARYVDPFAIEKNTTRPKEHKFSHAGLDPRQFEVKTRYPLQYKAWVEFKIEQLSDMFHGFKQAIRRATGKVSTSPFDGIVFADWAGLYPFPLMQERNLFGPGMLGRGFDLTALGGYCPAGFLTLGIWQQYLDYYESIGVRKVFYDSPATCGAGSASGGHECLPEHAVYYLLESAMNGAQGLLLFSYGGLEAKQLQLNARVFGAFALVDDILTEGRRVKGLSITGRQMHARGLQLGAERLVLAGDTYVATDKREGVLTCPVSRKYDVVDILKRKKLGTISPEAPSIRLTIEGVADRARFLYIGNRWAERSSR